LAGETAGMSIPAESPGEICLPGGFSFSAVSAGLKTSGRLDLAMVTAAPGTAAAAVFTKNRVVAAPVEIGRSSLKKNQGRVRALLVNAGNANCATGDAGRKACKQTCREAARLLNIRADEVFPSSTGIIGVPLPAEKIAAKLPELISSLQPTECGMKLFAQAIMTTDTRPKLASACFPLGSEEVRLLGIAKGSGMIHPKLATMLVYLFTDVVAIAA
jgi:glutamate N-acetyltransferase / amino-acid N-acetyltransferase